MFHTDNTEDNLRVTIFERKTHVKNLEMMVQQTTSCTSDLDLAADSMRHSIVAITDDITRLQEQTNATAATLASSEVEATFQEQLLAMGEAFVSVGLLQHDVFFSESREALMRVELEKIAEALQDVSDKESEAKRYFDIERRKIQNQIKELKVALTQDYALSHEEVAAEKIEIKKSSGVKHVEHAPDSIPTDPTQGGPGSPAGFLGVGRAFNKILGTMASKRDNKITLLESERATYHRLKKESSDRHDIITHLKKISGAKIPSDDVVRRLSESRKKAVVSRHTLDHLKIILEDLLKFNMGIEDEILALRQKYAAR